MALAVCGFSLFAAAASERAMAGLYAVGPHGAYPTLAAALAAAAGDPGVADVRVEEGLYFEYGLQATVQPGRELRIRGGWDRSFTRRSDIPDVTVFDAMGHGGILRVELDHGKFAIHGLTLRGAFTGSSGPDGALVVESDGGETLVENCVFADNLHQVWYNWASAATGAALVLANPQTDSTYRVRGSVFRDNRAEANLVQALAPALYIANSSGAIEVTDNLFERNAVYAGSIAGYSAGLIYTQTGDIAFHDNAVHGNQFLSGSSRAHGAIALISLAAGSTIEARRNHFFANRVSAGHGAQFSVWSADGSTAILSDSLVAASPDGEGLMLRAGGVVNVVNLTVADNRQGNVWAEFLPGLGQVSIANSIVDNRGAGGGYLIKTNGAITQVRNVVGVDPHFVDRVAGDYRLLKISPAWDFGHPSPPGGLGPLDLDGAPRFQGSRVDAGAFERVP